MMSGAAGRWTTENEGDADAALREAALRVAGSARRQKANTSAQKKGAGSLRVKLTVWTLAILKGKLDIVKIRGILETGHTSYFITADVSRRHSNVVLNREMSGCRFGMLQRWIWMRYGKSITMC